MIYNILDIFNRIWIYTKKKYIYYYKYANLVSIKHSLSLITPLIRIVFYYIL